MRKRIKQIALLGLSVLMIASSAIVSLADVSMNGQDGGINGEGGGEVEQGHNAAYASRYHVFTENQGIRIYLVDKFGNAQTNVVDFVQYKPEDIEIGGIGTDNSGGETTEEYVSLYKQYKRWTGFIDGVAYEKRGLDPIEKEFYYYSGTKTDGTDFGSTNGLVGGGKMYTIKYLEKMFELFYTSEYPGAVSPISDKDGYKIPVPCYRDNKAGTIVGTGNILRNKLMLAMPDNNDKNILGFITDLVMPKADGKGNIDLAGVEPLFTFKSEADRNAVLASGKNNVATVSRKNGYKIAIEPIHWAVAEVINPTAKHANGNDLNAYACSNYVVYGTESQIHKYIYDLNADKDRQLAFDYKVSDMELVWAWNTGKFAYQLSYEDPDLYMQPIPNNIKNTHQSLEYWGEHYADIGYGIMLMDTKPEDKTNTWDGTSTVPSEPVNGKGEFKVVKFYEQEEKPISYFIKNDASSTVDIMNESNWKLKEWCTATTGKIPTGSQTAEDYENYKDIADGKYKGTTEDLVSIPEGEKENILYVKLVADDSPVIPDGGTNEAASKQVTLKENELSHVFSTSALVDGLPSIYHSFPDKYKTGGSTHSGDEDEDDWECDWGTALSDGNYLIQVANGFDYNSTANIGSQGIFAGVEVGKVNTSNNEKATDINGFSSENVTPEYLFTLYRDKNKDKVTLYPGKNSGEVKNNLSLLGITDESYIPVQSRIKKETGQGEWSGTFQTGYNYVDTDNTLSYVGTGCSSHSPAGGSYDGIPNIGLGEFNQYYGSEGNLKTEYYLGEKNKGTAQPDKSQIVFTSNSNRNYKDLLSGKAASDRRVELFPYTKMLWQGQNGIAGDAYVTSENTSTMNVVSRVEIGTCRKGAFEGLLMESTQWSTHARVQNALGARQIEDKYSVLPGGAAYTLATNKGNLETWLGVRSWETIILDGQKDRLAKSDEILTVSEARAESDKMIGEIKASLDNLQVEQWVAPGIYKDKVDFSEGSTTVKVSGNNAEIQFMDNRLSTDSKYYLKEGSGADASDLDILGTEKSETLYRVFSDVDGNVVVTKSDNGGAEIELGRISKTERAEHLIGKNAEIGLLDNRTKVVTNFVNAIDRNKGYKVAGWYNEAFDGIGVLMTLNEIKVGFGNGRDIRGSILDTKLCGQLTERRDVWNFTPETIQLKARTSMFRTSDQSSIRLDKTPGYLGSYRDMAVGVSQLNSLLFSKLFYISNGTVTDLN